jgi:hypothetical protein
MYAEEPTVMNQNSQDDAVAEKGIDFDSIITISPDSEDETDVIIPHGFKDSMEIYEFEAAPEDGRMFISFNRVEECLKDYRSCFDSSNKNEDGSMGCIEEHRLIRKRWAVLVGLNGVHTEGWSLDKVCNMFKKSTTESPTATITFTFMDAVLAGA